MAALQPRPAPARQRWDSSVPPLLRPLLRAYVLGYASAVAPRLVTLLVQQVAKARSKDATRKPLPRELLFASLQRILQTGLEVQRFPTFCATLIGGTTLLEVPLRTLISTWLAQVPELTRQRLSRWFAAFIAAWVSIRLLQSKSSAAFEEVVPTHPENTTESERRTIRYAGRTLDLSLFALGRAVDVIVGELWAQRRLRRESQGQWTKMEAVISKLADPAVFATSSALIMWAWFYYPSRLPRTYNKWIGTAASVDERLIEALRLCRSGKLVYGQDTGVAHVLEGMCADYGWPLDWGNPAKAIPFRCEMVHMGCGPSCHRHALSRFSRSFKWSMATYLPLNILLVARSPNLKTFKAALISAARSSAFLASFITLFYYGVCLSRTLIGPSIIGKGTGARNIIDGGVCVGSGCFLCGWSILFEAESRRKDMALFVAPRALATLLPRRYAFKKQWRETAIFAVSTAVVFICVLENPKRVRGVLGRVLGMVMAP